MSNKLKLGFEDSRRLGYAHAVDGNIDAVRIQEDKHYQEGFDSGIEAVERLIRHENKGVVYV